MLQASGTGRSVLLIRCIFQNASVPTQLHRNAGSNSGKNTAQRIETIEVTMDVSERDTLPSARDIDLGIRSSTHDLDVAVTDEAWARG